MKKGSSLDDWRVLHDEYPKLVAETKHKEFMKLEKWLLGDGPDDLPALLQAQQHITQPQLSRLMAFKMLRGKRRFNLQGMVDALKPETGMCVDSQSRKAVSTACVFTRAFLCARHKEWFSREHLVFSEQMLIHWTCGWFVCVLTHAFGGQSFECRHRRSKSSANRRIWGQLSKNLRAARCEVLVQQRPVWFSLLTIPTCHSWATRPCWPSTVVESACFGHSLSIGYCTSCCNVMCLHCAMCMPACLGKIPSAVYSLDSKPSAFCCRAVTVTAPATLLFTCQQLTLLDTDFFSTLLLLRACCVDTL